MAIDSNTPVWPDALPVPMRAHQATGDLFTLRTQMDSGRIRKRRMTENPREGIEVTWNFTVDQFEEFKEFFDTNLENGASNFVITMFGRDREAEFRDSHYSFSRSDNLYTVSSSLLLAPLTEIPTDDFELYLNLSDLHGHDGGENWAE